MPSFMVHAWSADGDSITWVMILGASTANIIALPCRLASSTMPADMPPAAQALYASAKAAIVLGAPPPSALGAVQPQQPVAGQVMAFFSNPSAVHAAFWRAPLAEPCSTSSPMPSMGQRQRQRRQGQRAADPGSNGDLLDMEAMAELYEAIMAVKSQ